MNFAFLFQDKEEKEKMFFVTFYKEKLRE